MSFMDHDVCQTCRAVRPGDVVTGTTSIAGKRTDFLGRVASIEEATETWSTSVSVEIDAPIGPHHFVMVDAHNVTVIERCYAHAVRQANGWLAWVGGPHDEMEAA